MGVKLGSSN